jgi:hypothetical protein
MANFLYKKAKQSILNAEINFISNNLKLLIIDKTHYTPDENTDQYVSDIPANAIKKRSNNIQNVTNSLGVIDANDISISDYSGGFFDAIIMYADTGSDLTSRLIFFIDSSSGLPFDVSNSITPITIIWNDLSNKILSI